MVSPLHGLRSSVSFGEKLDVSENKQVIQSLHRLTDGAQGWRESGRRGMSNAVLLSDLVLVLV